MAIETTTSVDVKTLTPFKRFIMTLGILPTSYLESMTYAELVMWFCNFLQNEVIPAVNNNAEAVQEIQNWINTLDLQDEVDHKLDEMVEDGTIQTLLENYFNLINVRYYDTFIDALDDLEHIPLNYYIVTNGYNENNDNGGAKYKIEENDKGIGLTFGENYANIVYKDKINVLSLGIISSSEVNYTTNIQSLIDFASENGKIEIEFNNTNYYVSTLDFKTNINGNGCTFKCGYFNSNEPSVINYYSNITCKNYIVDASRLGSLANVRTDIRNKENINLINVHTQYFIDTLTSNAWGTLVTESHNINFIECSGDNATQSDVAVVENSSVNFKKCNYLKLNIEPNNALHVVNINIDECKINYLTGTGNSRIKMYITINISNSIINEISPKNVVLNATNSLLKKIECYSAYGKGSFRGNIFNCISLGKELNINPDLEDVINSGGTALQNGYIAGYYSGTLASALAYKTIDGVGSLLTLNPNKNTVMSLSTDKYNISPNKYYMFHLKYIAETTTANNVGVIMQPRFYNSSNVSIYDGDYLSGVVNVNENTGIQDDYIIMQAPANAVKCDFNIRCPYGTGEYQLIKCSIMEINSNPTNLN